ncbi:Mitoferrin-1 [Hypsibius exemplaris]|uniref:Mitoferrin-1 n=1 Tax=Hypsibius exemplaris TaxID=2072580 RepID=A0A1W0WPE8_HYPEX|nr:Mitoferrin-1 [Hypsibius exemplaris]
MESPDPLGDYEALPLNVSPYTHMGAGALAGIMEHCVMYPVDSVKTRMQSIRLASTYRGPVDALIKMVSTEGFLRPVRGIQAVFVGAGPAHAMYFACYENVKTLLEAQLGHGPLAHGLAGSAAAVFHDAVMNPAEVVKQRMQMFNSSYKSCTQCFTAIWRREGPRAFYRSYFTQLTMNVPFQGIHFMIYELMQDAMNPLRLYDPRSHVVSGAMAGAIAAAITTPLDVCKTLLNTQELCALNREDKAVRGLPQAMMTIYRCCGFRGYFAGLQARVIFQMPSTAISWSVYEFFKYFITKRSGATEEHG